MAIKKPKQFGETILLLGDLLKNCQYAFRGTASLVLQKIEMNIDDIDILCDKETALACNQLLKNFLIEEVAYKESDKFKSYFGKFKINDIPVEVMGAWEIKDTRGNWSGPFDASERKEIPVGDKTIYVTTVDSELFVFAKMGRWSAYHKIKRQLKGPEKEVQQTLF